MYFLYHTLIQRDLIQRDTRFSGEIKIGLKLIGGCGLCFFCGCSDVPMGLDSLFYYRFPLTVKMEESRWQ